LQPRNKQSAAHQGVCEGPVFVPSDTSSVHYTSPVTTESDVHEEGNVTQSQSGWTGWEDWTEDCF